MYIRKATIRHPIGLHGPSAVEFVKTASLFQSVVTVSRDIPDARVANAKSLMDLMSLGTRRDDTVVISANGADECKAVDKLVDFLENPPPKPKAK